MARSFNGSSDKISIPSLSFALHANRALAFWFDPTSLPGAYAGLLLSDDGGNSNGPLVYLKSSGALAFYPANWATGASNSDPLPSSTVSTATWNHFCATANQSTLTIYLNGTSILSESCSATINVATKYVLGTDLITGSRFFNGSMADATFWDFGSNPTLTASEASALAKGARPFQVRSSSLIGYLPLDGLQSPEPDLSGNKQNGTLTGTALAAGPPLMMFTPRWPQFNAIAAVTPIKFRKTLSQIGGRVGTRQIQGWAN